MGVSLKQAIHDEKLDKDTALKRIMNTYKLTDRQAKFVQIYVEKGERRDDAALQAGYAAKYKEMYYHGRGKPEFAAQRSMVQTIAKSVIENKSVQNAIREYQEIWKLAIRNEAENDVYRITKIRATYDIRDMVDTIVGDSTEEIVEKVKALTDDQAFCIDDITIDYKGKDANRFTVKVKFADRDKNVALLAKLAGMLVDKKEVTNIGDTMPTINIAVLNK